MFWQTKLSLDASRFAFQNLAGGSPCKGETSPPLTPQENVMARPSQNLTQRLTIRMTPEEMAQLKADADTAAVDVATIARAQITNAPIPTRKYRRSADHA